MTESRVKYSECPSAEIAAYVDGELDASDSGLLEAHFDECGVCRTELQDQRYFLCTLNASLVNENELRLPVDFARTVATRAESSVAGVRRPRELFNAIFICAALGLFVLFAFGVEGGVVWNGIVSGVDKVAAFVGFIGHITYSVLLGFGTVIKAIGSQIQVRPIMPAFTLVFFAMLFVFISRKLILFLKA